MVLWENKIVVFKNGYMMTKENNEPYVFENEAEAEAFKQGIEASKLKHNRY